MPLNLCTAPPSAPSLAACIKHQLCKAASQPVAGVRRAALRDPYRQRPVRGRSARGPARRAQRPAAGAACAEDDASLRLAKFAVPAATAGGRCRAASQLSGNRGRHAGGGRACAEQRVGGAGAARAVPGKVLRWEMAECGGGEWHWQDAAQDSIWVTWDVCRAGKRPGGLVACECCRCSGGSGVAVGVVTAWLRRDGYMAVQKDREKQDARLVLNRALSNLVHCKACWYEHRVGGTWGSESP